MAIKEVDVHGLKIKESDRELDSKIPAGAIEDKWTDYKGHVPLVSPANKMRIDIIVVGSGLAGASAAAVTAGCSVVGAGASGAGTAGSAGTGSSAFAFGAFVFAGFFSSESAMVKIPNR